MSFTSYQHMPPWDFFQSIGAGAGVDCPAYNIGLAHQYGSLPPDFGFGGAFGRGGFHGWSRGGGHRHGGPPGGHCHRRGPHDKPKDPSDPEKDPQDPKDPQNPEDPPTDGKSHESGPPKYTSGEESADGPSWGPWGHRGGGHRYRRGGRHHSPPPFGGPGGIPHRMSNFAGAFNPLMYTSVLHSYDEHKQANKDTQTFTPPIDIFSTPTAYVLHVALPGAKKEDIGVNWDADKKELHVAGVVHRPGDEAFLQSLTTQERRVGMFERNIRLPPPAAEEKEKEEVEGDNIVARMEDGVLIVTVPKVEKEWTEVRKVDIE